MQSDIVIVGGGAGGLELACKLGRKLGPDKVTLVDSRLYHVWKPSLHEVAAGTLDIHQEGLSYQMLAHDRGFSFVYGAMTALDAAAHRITIAPVTAAGDGEEVLPERTLGYRSLVIAVGSTSNYFGVPGAREHTISLNATEDAERFRLRLLRLLAQAAHQQADYLLKTFLRLDKGEQPQKDPYVYRDYGSLVSIGRETTVGSLMGSLRGASLFVEGFMARIMYMSLHLMHHKAVLGSLRTGLMAFARFLIRRTTPLVKLH
ncbi:FAD-dependent oxidoreductase [Massilia sp. CT11-108]|uniref:FAD-dependent oxidoreductase n=1 Tax=Massilia sp. CT11-108 TaxID=3393900 RepID=UPI0039A5107D